MSHGPQVSSVNEWFDGEVVQLSSKRFMRLRQLDVLQVMSEDGSVPNFMLPMLSGKAGQKETTGEDMLQLAPLLTRVASQAIVEPAIVSTVEDVRAGKGIMLSMIPLRDKMDILSYAMGGAAAVKAANRFLSEQDEPVADVPVNEQPVTESAAGDSERLVGLSDQRSGASLWDAR